MCIDVSLAERLIFNAQVRYLDIDTRGSALLGMTRAGADLDIDPWAYMVGPGYRF